MSVLLLALIIIVLPQRLQVVLPYHYHICPEGQKQEVRPADAPDGQWPIRKIIKNLAAEGQAGYVFQPFAWLRTNHVFKEQLWT
ncbi:MAG: hypothetical protein VR65_05645 [Desulfobulbaceae bacterium BRH_c16a]|nr:MAG: hypothetical protein VR65_05645 [Desulfobulbaceae bacterium BRH_c16a]